RRGRRRHRRCNQCRQHKPRDRHSRTHGCVSGRSRATLTSPCSPVPATRPGWGGFRGQRAAGPASLLPFAGRFVTTGFASTVHRSSEGASADMEPQWYYAQNNVQHGPVTAADIKQKAERGELLATDLVWKKGMGDWVAVRSVPELWPGYVPPPGLDY